MVQVFVLVVQKSLEVEDKLTRVDIVPVEYLTNRHLLSNHREIKRIPNCIKKGRFSLKGAPDTYTMGEGHVKFFYDKLKWLKKRYISLYDECIVRGLNVTDFSEAFSNLPKELYNDWTPCFDDYVTNQVRISERIAENLEVYK